MSYFPPGMPKPTPNADEAGFWENCRSRRLAFQGCAVCHQLRHPPTPMCPNCHSTKVEWRDAPAEGLVYTYNIVRHASHPAVVERLPYVVGIVEFPALAGVRLITNITDIPPEAVHIGMRVTLWWDDVGDGWHIPRFRPAEAVVAVS